MNLHEALEIRPGVTSVIGSGGKSTLLARLAAELAEGGATVALATTTHFMPFPGVTCMAGGSAEEVRLALAAYGVVCVAAPAGGAAGAAGKLGPAALAPAELARLADYVLVEADGSKQLPLKAHAAWEPVMPEGSTQSVLVVGASGFGRPVDGRSGSASSRAARRKTRPRPRPWRPSSVRRAWPAAWWSTSARGKAPWRTRGGWRPFSTCRWPPGACARDGWSG